MKKSVPDIVADVLIYIFLGVLTIVCLIPFLHVASMSVSLKCSGNSEPGFPASERP